MVDCGTGNWTLHAQPRTVTTERYPHSLFYFFLWDRVSLSCLGWPWTSQSISLRIPGSWNKPLPPGLFFLFHVHVRKILGSSPSPSVLKLMCYTHRPRHIQWESVLCPLGSFCSELSRSVVFHLKKKSVEAIKVCCASFLQVKSIGIREQDFSADFTAVYYIEVQTVCSSLPILQRLYNYLKKKSRCGSKHF